MIYAVALLQDKTGLALEPAKTGVNARGMSEITVQVSCLLPVRLSKSWQQKRHSFPVPVPTVGPERVSREGYLGQE